MTLQNPLAILQQFSPQVQSATGQIAAGQQVAGNRLALQQQEALNPLLLEQQQLANQQRAIQTRGLESQENISNTVNRLQELERQIGFGATPQQLEATLQGFITESQARGGNPADSQQALQALQQGGVQGLQGLLGQAKQVFQQQGLISPTGGQAKKIQTATNIPGKGSQVTFADGTTRFIELTEEEQARLSELEETERQAELEFMALKDEQELDTLDEAERRKRLQKQRSDISTGIRSSAQDAARQKPKVNQLIEALDNLQTGKAAEAKRILGRFIPGIDIANEEAFLAQVQSLVLEQAQNLSGALSDSDIQLLKDSVPSLGNTVAGNRAILNNMLQAMDLKIQEGSAFNEFESAGGMPEQFIFEPTDFVDFGVSTQAQQPGQPEAQPVRQTFFDANGNPQEFELQDNQWVPVGGQ